MSKRDFIKDIDSDELQSVLKKYDFEIVNQVPFSEKPTNKKSSPKIELDEKIL